MRSSPPVKSLIFGAAFAIALVLFLGGQPVMGQETSGTIKGRVTDTNRAAVPGATVTVKSQDTGFETTTVSNDDGSFNIPKLQPGKYTVTVTTTAGFKKKEVTNLNVALGDNSMGDILLEAGAVTETVTVTAGTEEIVNREQAQISTSFESRKVADLPSNGAGGGIDTLALLAPGVVANRVGGTNTNGSGLSINGNRGRSNNFQIDGADNNDLSVGGPALFVDFQDSVQEYQIITNNYSAQYGRNQGGIINIVGKSGTNDYHGSLFLFHQDAAVLNTIDNISRAAGVTRNDPNLYNVFGGTIGGHFPLPRFGEGGASTYKGKDRFFFFFGYQGIRNPALFTSRSTSLGILPGEFARLQATFPGNAVINTIAGYSPWAIPGAALNSTATSAVVQSRFNLTPPSGCPRAIGVAAAIPTGTGGIPCGVYTTFINPATGLPFLTGGPYDTLNFGTAGAPLLFQAAQYQRTRPVGYNENYYTLRLDFRAGNNDSFSVRYLNQKSASQNSVGSIASGFTGDIPASSKHFGGSWTHNFSSHVVNEFRPSFQKIGVEFGGGCSAATPGCIPGPAQLDVAFANVSFSPALGLSKANTMPTIGPATNLPQGRIGKVYQFADTVNWSLGQHSLVLGGEYKYLNTLVPFLPNYNGTYAFNSAARIIANAPSGVSITLGDPLLAFKERDQYYFLQDDWKIRSNLTLNLGVRYEYTGQPINQLSDVTIARESGPTPFFNPALPLSIRTVPKVPVDKNNFAPRLGFAWSPKFESGFLHKLVGEDATVIRGGFSLAYDAAFYNILLNVQNAAPFAVALTIPGPSLPAVGSPAPLPNNPIGTVVRAAAQASGVLPLGVLNPIYLSQTRVSSDFHSPFSRQFSFGIQRQMGRNHVVEARYVGTQGRDLFQNINANFFTGPLVNGMPNWFGTGINMPSFAALLPAGTTAQVCVDVAGTSDNEGACNGRLLRQAGITDRSNTASSDYHALQTRYNGRFFRNSVSLGMAYTWSKTIDNASEIFAFGDIASPNAQNPFCIDRCERALSNLNRPHAFSANFVWDIPWLKEQRGVVGRVLGGWQLNGTYILTSGAAYTASQSFNGNFGLGNTYLTSGDRPFIGNPAADERQVAISQPDAAVLFGCPLTNINAFYSMNLLNSAGTCTATTPSAVRFIFNGPGAARIFGTPFGDSVRNSLKGPIFNQLNMSLFKNIKIYERLNLQLRVEAFNVLNHPNPGFGTGSGGALPSIFIGNAGAEGAGFAEHRDISYGIRVVQVGARLIF